MTLSHTDRPLADWRKILFVVVFVVVSALQPSVDVGFEVVLTTYFGLIALA